MLFLIAMAQAATSTPEGKIDLDILQRCQTSEAAGDDVVVCGRRDESRRYRLPPPAPDEPTFGRAEARVGDAASVSAETERVEIGGTPSNRVMIRLKFKF